MGKETAVPRGEKKGDIPEPSISDRRGMRAAELGIMAEIDLISPSTQCCEIRLTRRVPPHSEPWISESCFRERIGAGISTFERSARPAFR
jgi:hypothetical protein